MYMYMYMQEPTSPTRYPLTMPDKKSEFTVEALL